MKKSDIKNGMHVITNNGVEYVIISGIEANRQTLKANTVMVQIGGYGGWMPFDKYDDDLHYYESEDERGEEDYDIREVYAPNFYAYALKSVHDNVENRFVKLWERSVKQMTKAEIEAELGYEIEIVD